MGESMQRREMEAVLARAIELEAADHDEFQDFESLVRIAQEVGVGPDAVQRAFSDRHIQRRPTWLDNLIGSGVVTRSRMLPGQPEFWRNEIARRMALLRLTPALRNDTWLQQRTTWPDPTPGLTVAAVQTAVQPTETGSRVVVSASCTDARLTSAAGLAGVFGLGLLIGAIGSGWGIVAGVGGALAALRAARHTHERRLQDVATNLDSLLADLAP